MEPGQVVEFIDSQKIFCAVVMEIKSLRLRLLTENNREVKMSAERLSHRSRMRLEPSAARDKLAAGLKEIAQRRKELSRQVDIPGLWSVLYDEQQWVDLPTMTALCFPDHPDGDHESAVIRAFFSDRLYFKFSPDQFFPHTAEKVEQIARQREKEARDARIIEQGGQWLQKVFKGQEAAVPGERDEIVPILIEVAQPDGPFGARGVGEHTMIPAASMIANAVEDALGIRIKSMPITAEKIALALKKAG